MLKREQKTAILNVRIMPTVKKLAEHMADQDRRSVASWLEILIEEEAARRGVKVPSKGRS